MKKFIMIIIGMMLMMSFVYAEDVVAVIPDYEVNVNGTVIDVEHSQYPILSYNGVTYFPMTYDYLTGVGLSLDFSSEQGLIIHVKDTLEPFNQSFLGANNVLGSQVNATVASYPITVNGQTVNNSEEAYPVITYNNITYFPMTWKFAVTEFGWTTTWDDVNGYGIIIEKEKKVVVEPEATVHVSNDLSYSIYVENNNSVGNEWFSMLKHGEKDIIGNESEIPFTVVNGQVTFDVVVYESDKNGSDYGYGTIVVPYAVLENKTPKTYETLITVAEDAGRYKGNTARVRFSLDLFKPTQ